MAKDTDPRLQNAVLYSVFVRNHTPEGTFRAVIPDLPRIRALGADFIWLMPVHPIGEKERKGTLGSPYAISDYRAVNPEYGTLDDFRALVDAIHANGMRCMIFAGLCSLADASRVLLSPARRLIRQPDRRLERRY